jgi:hypothetical protein
LALTFAIAVGGRLVDYLLDQEREGLPLPSPNAAQREEWQALLRTAVLKERVRKEDSDLRQMVRVGPIVDPKARDYVDLSMDDVARPRLRIRGRTVALSEITRQWDESPSRLVILGEPGYGKTVAALMLLEHINGNARGREAVAELFRLAEWHRWHVENPRDGLDDWLADQLTTTYPDLPQVVSAALVDSGLVLPILDGLDEVPAGGRIACRDQIDAYAGRSEPFRPFVLTCRAREYTQLEADWVPADRQIVLVGLQADQIAQVLEVRTSRWPEWAVVRGRIKSGDQYACELFRSPLRLGIALQAHRRLDPGSLLELDLDAAKAHLWDSFLELGGPGFDGASPEQLRSWLLFLAAGMHRESRQRFWLHELFALTAHRHGEFRRFKVRLGVAVWLICAVIVGLPLGLWAVLPGDSPATG